MKKLLAVLMLLLIAVPSFASAATLDMTDATLDELKTWQVQIAERIAELEVAPTPTPEVAAEAGAPDTVAVTIQALKKGDKNDDVKVLQQRLTDLGYYTKKIDGDYGAGVAAAVKTFQGLNGLEQSGEADTETMTVLFSAGAAKMPEPPALAISKVNVYKSYGYYFFRLDVKNNTDKDIDAFDIRIKVFNKYGDRLSNYGGSDYISNAGNEAQNSIQSYQGKKIKAGDTKKMTKSEEFELYGYDGAVNVEVAICRFHTTDGETVNIPSNKWIWHNGDGTVTYPVDDGYVEPEITSEASAAAEKFLLGFNGTPIYDYIAPIYDKPSGMYLDSVSDGPTDDAGLEAGDIIISIDGVRLNIDGAIDYVKSKMEPGEAYEVVYYRKGEYHTTEINMPE